MNPLAQKVQEIFIRKFKRSPRLFFSPGRINLIGEHIDYNDGFVMPCAINKGMYYAVAINDTDTINIYSRDYEEMFSLHIDNIKPDEDWKNYLLSVLHEFQLAQKKISGFDCVIGANIPSGAGLSSSAALEGGLAFALNEIFEYGFSREQLAFLCQQAEHGFPQVNCGIMDQYANMFGKKEEAIFLDCMKLRHENLPLHLGEYSLVLINTKVHHALAASAYNTRRNECETGLKIIRDNSSYKSFREIKNSKVLKRFEEKMGRYVLKRCTFVVEEIQRTKEAARLLKKKKIKEFGALMFQSHDGLSDLYKVSCAELDFLVKFARSNEDVIGARMMGGGFGGCTINIVKASSKDKFIAEALASYKKEFQNAAESYDVVTADGTHELAVSTASEEMDEK